VLVMAYSRQEYLEVTLDSIFAAHPDPEVRANTGRGTLFPIFVSQDGSSNPVTEVIEGHAARLTHMQHRHPNIEELGSLDKKALKKKWIRPYIALSMHYKKALTTIFDLQKKFRHVIVLEEDLPVSIDFFEYMIATGPLLEADPSLYCVSAWNDNGQDSHTRDPAALFRTDLFPGLGWMLARGLWAELAGTWPIMYWDDYMRHPARRRGRQCIRPEISRTKHIGVKGGASRGQLRKKLGKLVGGVNMGAGVAFTSLDLSFLLRDPYDEQYDQLVLLAKELPPSELSQYALNAPVQLSYTTSAQQLSVRTFSAHEVKFLSALSLF
jgi:alpha-1,3-mannosyl-glycoprotein beta-1,2-N-acetylglucosaminyltransferase